MKKDIQQIRAPTVFCRYCCKEQTSCMCRCVRGHTRRECTRPCVGFFLDKRMAAAFEAHVNSKEKMPNVS